MKPRNFYILLGVFALLLIIAVLQSRLPSSTTAAPLATPANFVGKDLNMTVLDIVAIQLLNPSTNTGFTISRNAAGNWTAPQSKGSLDTTAASNIAKAVVLMEYDSKLPITSSTDLQQYGFTPHGQLLVGVLLQNQQTHAIAIAGLAPSGADYYGRVDDDPNIYLFTRGAVDYLISQLNHPPLT